VSDGPDHIRVGPRTRIPLSELDISATRSGGPGGQHANTSSTKVELRWDLNGSPSLSAEEKARVRKELGNRISREGVLRLTDASTRSQHRNREAAVSRLRKLLRSALKQEKKRRPTRPTRASKERRLQEKKHRAQVKRQRGPVRRDE